MTKKRDLDMAFAKLREEIAGKLITECDDKEIERVIWHFQQEIDLLSAWLPKNHPKRKEFEEHMGKGKQGSPH
jgi:hypothetical protein